ncbi:MAG: DUF1361 domain-containing protein [Candidatus Saccharibacteria bacterium]
MIRLARTAKNQYALALGYATAVSGVLYAYGALREHSLAYSYLPWNLLLSWLPLGLALWLAKTLETRLWSSWKALAITVAWLLFLPNSFYMISDYIHLQDVAHSDILYDAVLFTSFIFSGVALGLSSLYIIHRLLQQRFSARQVGGIIALTLGLCSFAIYIGRDLRWNSWDILTNPGGLLFDVSDRILHPAAYPAMFVTVASFFVLLSSVYGLVWWGSQLLRHSGRPNLL